MEREIYWAYSYFSTHRLIKNDNRIFMWKILDNDELAEYIVFDKYQVPDKFILPFIII